MKYKLLTLSAALFFGVVAAATAGGTCNGCRIKNLGAGPYYDSICSSGTCVFIKIEQTVNGRPYCASNQGWDFALDTSTASGKATYALLLTAYTTGQIVNVSGSNACSISSSGLVENLYFVNFAQ
jgi:hypothetical protein